MLEARFDETPLAQFDETSHALIVTPLVRALDAECAPALRSALAERARGRPLVVVSLAHVVRVDCSGLAVLVSTLKCMAPGGELRLVGVSRAARALLRATHLDEVFPAYDDAADALTP